MLEPNNLLSPSERRNNGWLYFAGCGDTTSFGEISALHSNSRTISCDLPRNRPIIRSASRPTTRSDSRQAIERNSQKPSGIILLESHCLFGSLAAMMRSCLRSTQVSDARWRWEQTYGSSGIRTTQLTSQKKDGKKPKNSPTFIRRALL